MDQRTDVAVNDSECISIRSWARRLHVRQHLAACATSTLRVDPEGLGPRDRPSVATLVAAMSLPALLMAPLVVQVVPALFRRDPLMELGVMALWICLVLLAGRPMLVPSQWRRTGWFALPVRIGLSVFCGVVLLERVVGIPGTRSVDPESFEVLGARYVDVALPIRDPIASFGAAPGISWTQFLVLVLLVVAVDLAVLAGVAAGRSRLPASALDTGSAIT